MYIYLSLILITILSFSYVILDIYNYNKIKIVYEKKYFTSNFQNQIYSFFIYFTQIHYSKLSKILNTQIKISIKNLYGEGKFIFHEIIFISKKICHLFYILILLLYSFVLLKENIILLSIIPILFLYSKIQDKAQIDLYEKEKKNFKNDLPSFISRLTLLINSGIRLRPAINYIINNSSGEVVNKMKNVNTLINNGISEIEAYDSILKRSDDILIRKFILNIVQNIQKGGDDLEKILDLMKKESDEFRKTQIVLKTQEANSKLLIPNLFIFSGILLMVMLPILLNAI